jgi:hypothetical protein
MLFIYFIVSYFDLISVWSKTIISLISIYIFFCLFVYLFVYLFIIYLLFIYYLFIIYLFITVHFT